ncbi:hypothetical protein BDF20DRAFT_861575 [Mycotypha africana]|uniref:uncharacterized protein n=1 Tax=Mycotypha africana TaxID=64632 RepID=UPI0022FFF27F|nr:uncharacterized protein BDF20DRAFT_861575 [Mycotypha africana]KAI8984753.1 hypothetical protein BDF20DRAFT_861575 [Mycotypha africana]
MTVEPETYLRTLPSIRERCQKVYEKAQQGQLQCFDIHEDKALPAIVEHVLTTTQRRFSDVSSVPPHSRLRHFDPRDIEGLMQTWQTNNVAQIEQARRLVDLVIVSVLLDAGAGQVWKYKTQRGDYAGRSEGLAIASFDMFIAGRFSTNEHVPDQVDVGGLNKVTVERMAADFQVTEENPMVGLEGRSNLLKRLAAVMDEQSMYFPTQNQTETRRPGHLVDYVLSSVDDVSEQGSKKALRVEKIWEAVMSLGAMWPARVQINGVQMGDVWPCPCLTSGNNSNDAYEDLVPFHKLSQWLTYSLIEAIETGLNVTVQGVELLTGLPEYRNGGLLVDYGLLTLKSDEVKRGIAAAVDPEADDALPTFEGSDPVIVEWRALTVIYLDIIKQKVEEKLGKKLLLAQVLEGGTWTAGREVAAKLRPKDGGPPIVIKSDGTIF